MISAKKSFIKTIIQVRGHHDKYTNMYSKYKWANGMVASNIKAGRLTPILPYTETPTQLPCLPSAAISTANSSNSNSSTDSNNSIDNKHKRHHKHRENSANDRNYNISCEICYNYYTEINETDCCQNHICTECIAACVDPVALICPFCKKEHFMVSANKRKEELKKTSNDDDQYSKYEKKIKDGFDPDEAAGCFDEAIAIALQYNLSVKEVNELYSAGLTVDDIIAAAQKPTPTIFKTEQQISQQQQPQQQPPPQQQQYWYQQQMNQADKDRNNDQNDRNSDNNNNSDRKETERNDPLVKAPIVETKTTDDSNKEFLANNKNNDNNENVEKNQDHESNKVEGKEEDEKEGEEERNEKIRKEKWKESSSENSDVVVLL